MGVGRKGRHQLPAKPGEQVDHAARQVAGGQHLPEEDRGIRLTLRGQRHDRVAADDRRGEERRQAQERRGGGRQHPHHAHRLGDREVEIRRRHGVHAAEELLILVRPAGIINDPVDGRRDFPRRRRPRAGRGLHPHQQRRRQLGGPGLQHLRQPVEDLAAVVGRALRPARAGRGRGLDRVAQVLARALRDVGEKGPGRVPERKHARALRADEGAADIDLGRFGDGKSAHGKRAGPGAAGPAEVGCVDMGAAAGGLRPDGNSRAGPGGRPRGRSRSPCSRRRARRGRTCCRCWPRPRRPSAPSPASGSARPCPSTPRR